MTETPMALIRKLDETAAALRELAAQVRQAALEVEDFSLRCEMLESAENLESRAQEMTDATERLRVRIN